MVKSPFSQTVSTNVAKRFLDLLDKHFPPNNQLHKMFNRSTVKVSYSCTPNVGFHHQITQQKPDQCRKQAKERFQL